VQATLNIEEHGQVRKVTLEGRSRGAPVAAASRQIADYRWVPHQGVGSDQQSVAVLTVPAEVLPFLAGVARRIAANEPLLAALAQELPEGVVEASSIHLELQKALAAREADVQRFTAVITDLMLRREGGAAGTPPSGPNNGPKPLDTASHAGSGEERS
jgi:hypothetical protein